MNLRKIYIQVTFLLLANFTGKLNAQHLTSYLQKADSLFEAKQHEEAVKIYHRVWFFCDNEMKQEMASKYVLAMFETKQFHNLKQIIFYPKENATVSLTNEEVLIGIAAIFNLEQWELCLDKTELYLMDSCCLEPEFQANLLYFKLLSQVKLAQKQDAMQTAEALKKYTHNTNAQSALDSLIKSYQNHTPYNVKSIKTLSSFLPGLGQLYMKDFQNAGNAILLNGGLITATVVTAHFYNWPQAVLFWVYYVPHFYFGNAKSAVEIAHAKNEAQNNLYFEAFKNIQLE